MNLGHETEQVEFKKSTSELKEGMASIAAILNKHGKGTLYFGVKNNGDVCGQQVADSTLREISQAVGNYIKPAVYPLIALETSDEGSDYIRVEFEGKRAPYSCDGRYRIRVADEDVLLSSDEVRSFFIRAEDRLNPWDSQESNFTIEDIDEEALKAFVERGNARQRISEPYDGVQETLERLQLVRNGKLLNAAVALFCPRPYMDLKMGVLASHARTEILDLRQEEGLIFDLVEKAERYIRLNTRNRVDTSGPGASDVIPELPEKAVHEALMNAYAHRRWAAGAAVVVDIYNDAVEITSPGWFIEGQDPEEHMTGASQSSETRNPLITKTLYRSGDIEAYGTGIKRVKDLCGEVGVRVEYKRVPEGTRLIFHRNDAFAEVLTSQVIQSSDAVPHQYPTSTPPVTPPVELLLLKLGQNSLSFSELQTSLGLADRNNFRTNYLNEALNAGFIERTIPDKPSSSKQKYRLTALGRETLKESR